MTSETLREVGVRAPVVGRLLLGVAVLHTLFGLVGGWSMIAGAVGEGWVGRWTTTPDRQLIFWFLMTGGVLLLLGVAVGQLERAGLLRRGWCWALLLTAAVGVSAMPVSGFWLLLVPAGVLWWRTR